MPKPDPLELLKAIKQKEVVDKPVFRLSKPGQNAPLKMQSGQESEFAKAHNSSEAQADMQASGEDQMREKHLMKIKGLAESGAVSGPDMVAKKIPNYANIAISSFKQKEIEKEKFRNEEDRFKMIIPDSKLERTKRDVMFEHRMNEDEAFEFMVRENMFQGHGESKLVDQALTRKGWKPVYDEDGELMGFDDPKEAR